MIITTGPALVPETGLGSCAVIFARRRSRGGDHEARQGVAEGVAARRVQARPTVRSTGTAARLTTARQHARTSPETRPPRPTHHHPASLHRSETRPARP